jgi:hypothetical protein
LGLVTISTFFGCKESIHAPLDSSHKFKPVTVKVDLDYIKSLEARFDAYEATFDPNKKPLVTITEDSDTQFDVLTEPRPIFKFESIGDYELMLSVVTVAHVLGEQKVSFYPKLQTLRKIWGIGYEDLHWLSQEGKIIIGDTLYTLEPDRQIKESLSTGMKFVDYYPHPSGTSYSKTFTHKLPELYPDIENKTEVPFTVYGIDFTAYEGKVICRNESVTTLGVRRAIAETKLHIKRAGTQEFNDNDLRNLDPRQLQVSMTSTFTILLKGCRTRTTTAIESGLSAYVSTGRCANTGVTSLHWATVRNNPLVSAEYVE